jgi:hypothetical protein
MAVAARRADWSGGVPTRPTRPGAPALPSREPELPFPAGVGEPELQASDVIEAEAPSGWSRLRWSNLRRGIPALRRRWIAVAGLAVLVFAIAIGVLTAFGASTKQSAFPLGGTSGGSGKSPSAPVSTPAVTSSPTPAPTPSASATATPSPAPTPSASSSPSASATPEPGASSPAPSAAPSVGVTESPSPDPATVP